jgi:transcription antitermination protein NusB
MKKSERRSAARLAASQALYQMEIAGKGLNDILAEFEAHWIGREIEGESYTPAELAFFRDVVSGVQRDQLPIDRGLDDTLAKGWPLKRVEALMRAILRAAFYELRSRPDVPARVAVTEYVDVAAAFFGPEESGMINAVLDALARQIRPAEFAAGRGPRSPALEDGSDGPARLMTRKLRASATSRKIGAPSEHFLWITCPKGFILC